MVHEAAQTGFNRAADAYERGRPSYPLDAVDWLLARIPPTSRIADLAAGTGKFTRLLRGHVVAIEPVAGMRTALAAAVPSARVVGGTAEAIPLRDGTAGVVTVAQAFHWFDGDAALREIHRVLTPDGVLAIVFNDRDKSDALNVAIDKLVDPHRHGAPNRATGRWRDAFSRTTSFASSDEATFAYAQELDEDGLADRVLSTSVIASLDPEPRAVVERAVRALAGSETVQLPYVTKVALWTRSDP